MNKFDRSIPGTIQIEGREHLYISDDGNDRFAKKGLFDKITTQVKPAVPKSGGAITGNCKLWLPTGELFHALSYKGDINGWREQIEQGAKQLGLLTGKIVGENIKLSDYRTYALLECKVEFY